MRTILETPPIPRVVPEDVFDAFGWATSQTLEWRGPGGALRKQGPRGLAGPRGDERLTPDNPPRMVFVMKRELPFLPRELARLHAPGLGLDQEWALAPYAIDDATDELYARRLRPGDVLSLATDSLSGLFWGLHDWAHFHNHGPFLRRAWTELQCDAAALAWLWGNRFTLGLLPASWEVLRQDAAAFGAARFVEEGLGEHAADLQAQRIQRWVDDPGMEGDRTSFGDGPQKTQA